MDLICSECEGFIRVYSIEKIGSDFAKITFICTNCGNIKTERNYMYELKVK